MEPDTLEISYFSAVEHELLNRPERPCQVANIRFCELSNVAQKNKKILIAITSRICVDLQA